MVFTNWKKCAHSFLYAVADLIGRVKSKKRVIKEVICMTHNQVAYWDSMRRYETAKESNRISQQEADTNKFNAERNEYWTHKNYNWNESMFGYQLFKDLSSMIGGAVFGGIF